MHTNTPGDKENADRPGVPAPWYLPGIRTIIRGIGCVSPTLAARLVYALFSRPRKRARHLRSDQLLRAAERRSVAFGRIDIRRYSWGKGKKAICLVHGWESRGTALRHFVPALLEKGFRVYAFDGPAHGDSGGKATGVRDFGGALKRVLETIEEPLQGMVTHSFGLSALLYAQNHLIADHELPSLVATAVPATTEQVISEVTQLLGLSSRVTQAFRDRLCLENRLTEPEIQLEYALKQARIGKILMIHDRDDEVVPFQTAEAYSRVRPEHTELLLTSRLGHFRLVKDAGVIKKTARFLAG